MPVVSYVSLVKSSKLDAVLSRGWDRGLEQRLTLWAHPNEHAHALCGASNTFGVMQNVCSASEKVVHAAHLQGESKIRYWELTGI